MTAPITPLYAKQLGASDGAAALVVASLMVPLLVVDLVGSKVVPRLGPRAALCWGYAIFGVGSLGTALSPDLRWMALARVVQGFAAALPMGAGFHVALRLASPGREAREIARFNVCLFAGLAVGPMIVAIVAGSGVDMGRMRWSFAVCASVNVLTALVAWVALPPLPTTGRATFGLPSRSVVRGRRVRLALATTGVAFALRGVVGMTLMPLLGDSLGAGALGVSAGVVVMSAFEVAGTLTSGRLADRFGRRPVVCGAAAAGVVLSTWAMTTPPLPGYFALCAVSGFVLAGLRVAPSAMLADVAASSEDAAVGWRLASDVGMVSLSVVAGASLQLVGLTSTFGFAALLTAVVGVLGFFNGETRTARAPATVDALVASTVASVASATQ